MANRAVHQVFSDSCMMIVNDVLMIMVLMIAMTVMIIGGNHRQPLQGNDNDRRMLQAHGLPPAGRR